jgi:hypothetical protein
VLVSEGSMSNAVMARRCHSAGVGEHITCKRTALEPRKPHRVRRLVAVGGVLRGKTRAARRAEMGWRIEV